MFAPVEFVWFDCNRVAEHQKKVELHKGMAISCTR